MHVYFTNTISGLTASTVGGDYLWSDLSLIIIIMSQTATSKEDFPPTVELYHLYTVYRHAHKSSSTEE